MQPKSNPSDTAREPGTGASSPAPRSDRRKRNIPVATDRRNHEPSPPSGAASDRRKRDIPAAADSRKPSPSADSTSSDVADFAATEEFAFKKAMDRYKRENRRPFPTWSEVLEVLRSLGYRKVAEESEFPGAKAPPAKG